MEQCYMNILPPSIRAVVLGEIKPDDEEIRISVNRPIRLMGKNRRVLGYRAAKEDCERLLELICGHSVFAHEDELKDCYVTLEDGSRVGMAGRLTEAGMTMPHSFNIRIAHEVKGAADEMIKHVCGNELCSVLLVSSPGTGKTTVLRDAARQLSIKGYRVGIADERGEIAAAVNGIPKLDVGYADVMGGCPKAQAMSLLLRGMSPDVLITDEISSEEEGTAILDASGCGIKVIASAHGSDKGILRRQGIGKAAAEGAFDKVLMLKKDENGRHLLDITREVICE